MHQRDPCLFETSTMSISRDVEVGGRYSPISRCCLLWAVACTCLSEPKVVSRVLNALRRVLRSFIHDFHGYLVPIHTTDSIISRSEISSFPRPK